jgi:acetylglutamate kinase
VSDVPGVRVDGAVAPVIAAEAAEALIQSGQVTGGMIVKLRQALVAADAGVEVRIGGGEILADPNAGTRILPAAGSPAASTASLRESPPAPAGARP